MNWAIIFKFLDRVTRIPKAFLGRPYFFRAPTKHEAFFFNSRALLLLAERPNQNIISHSAYLMRVCSPTANTNKTFRRRHHQKNNEKQFINSVRNHSNFSTKPKKNKKIKATKPVWVGGAPHDLYSRQNFTFLNGSFCLRTILPAVSVLIRPIKWTNCHIHCH